MIGQPLTRPDGPAKVTGRARYAADLGARELLYAVFVTATVAAGRVISIDFPAVGQGVVRVLTHKDMPRLRALEQPPAAQSFMPMQDDEIRHDVLKAIEANQEQIRLLRGD